MKVYCTNKMPKIKFARGLANNSLAESLNYLVDDESKSLDDQHRSAVTISQTQKVSQT